jgi:reactive intermediate/imine deaminase
LRSTTTKSAFSWFVSVTAATCTDDASAQDQSADIESVEATNFLAFLAFLPFPELHMPLNAVTTPDAPGAIGTYSQAIKTGNTVYLSGQIPLDPQTMELVTGEVEAHVRRVFDNLRAVAKAAGGDLSNAVKLNVYLTDLGNFQTVNKVMAEYFEVPYPARAAIGVAALPRGAVVEVDAVLVL